MPSYNKWTQSTSNQLLVYLYICCVCMTHIMTLLVLLYVKFNINGLSSSICKFARKKKGNKIKLNVYSSFYSQYSWQSLNFQILFNIANILNTNPHHTKLNIRYKAYRIKFLPQIKYRTKFISPDFFIKFTGFNISSL